MINSDKNSLLEGFLAYRKAACNLWNEYFREKFDEASDWAFVDSFNIIKYHIFRSIVLLPLLRFVPKEFDLGLPTDIFSLRVKRDISAGVQINREKGRSFGYWDHPVEELSSDSEFLFVNFFDWNAYGIISMPLVLAEIIDCPKNPELIGHFLLIDFDLVDVNFGRGALEVLR